MWRNNESVPLVSSRWPEHRHVANRRGADATATSRCLALARTGDLPARNRPGPARYRRPSYQYWQAVRLRKVRRGRKATPERRDQQGMTALPARRVRKEFRATPAQSVCKEFKAFRELQDQSDLKVRKATLQLTIRLYLSTHFLIYYLLIMETLLT